jgi:hypothetical protein
VSLRGAKPDAISSKVWEEIAGSLPLPRNDRTSFMDNKLEIIVRLCKKILAFRSKNSEGEAHIFARPEQIVDVITSLRDAHGFELLSALTAVDYWPGQEPRFTRHLSVDVDREEPVDPGPRPGSGDQPGRPDRDRCVRLRGTGASANSGTCSASASRAIPTCAAFDAADWEGIRCARITRWAMKSRSSPSTSKRSTCASLTPRNSYGPATRSNS